MLLVVVLTIAVSTEAKKSRKNEAREGFVPLPPAETTFVESNLKEPVFQRPVPFGHIFRDGFDDPNSKQKQPIDPLELNTIYLKDSYIARDVIEKLKMEYQPVVSSEKFRQIDQHLFSQSQKNFPRGMVPEARPRTNESVTYWNFARLQQRNMYEPPRHSRRLSYQRDKIPPPEHNPLGRKRKEDYISTRGFYLDQERENNYNFTTCDEFGRNALFHPNDIVDLDWIPFYIWTTELAGRVMTAKIHNFKIPTQKQVRNYSDEFKQHLNKSLDWEQPKLVMKQDMLEMLLIAADRRGLFDAIPFAQIPEHHKNSYKIKLPTIPIRFKILDPYLVMMYCDERYATIMAVVGSEPVKIKDKLSKAGLAKIKGPGYVVDRDKFEKRFGASGMNREQLMREQPEFITSADQRLAELPMNKPIIL